MGLVRLGCALACGFFFRLLALPVGAGKGVDGIIPGDVDFFRFGVYPFTLPVALRQAGGVVFVPQAHAPAPTHAGAAHSRGIGVHGGALHLAAVPNSLAVRGQFNFIASLAHAVNALPRQEQRPGIHAKGRGKMIRFQIYCSHRWVLLFNLLPIL